ncbi:MAG: 4Fe-4S dicluster domain-containing protein [Deltaproteobacteria bacterium]|nr:4Fe-4S dicluster domain-containing protein [Deltaproteobacteria bacterium]
MRVDEKIALDAFRQDSEPHIRLRQERCAPCPDRVCLRVCPGGLYSLAETSGEVRVECSGCLECGSCLSSCIRGAIDWSYPRGGFGVRYRAG